MAIVTVTNTLDSGAGSLREILTNAQSGDTVKFASSLANKKITLTSGEIKILKEVNINNSDAPNLTISGNYQSRIFNIGNRQNRINVTIKNLTFADGRAIAGTVDDKNIAGGGAIRIHDFSDLVVENSTFNNNVAERGGAIHVNYGGSLTVSDSIFDGNDGSIADDGFSGGAIATHGSGGEPGFDPGNGFLQIEDSQFTNNKGVAGGAVYSLLGPLTIENSVFKDNESTGDGGAIFTDGANSAPRNGKGGQIIIRNTVVENNKAKGQGGGLFLWTYNPDEVLIEGSRIVDNSTTFGGIYNDSKAGGVRVANGKLTIRNSTIANNTTDKQGGGLWVDSPLGVTIDNSTFSGNKAKLDQGGAITFNTPDGTPVKITNTTFANNSTGRDAGAIWSHGGNSDDITLINTIFAGNTAAVTKQGNTNFQLKDGGGNFVENIVGERGPKVTATATYVDDLKLSDTLELIGDDLMYTLESDSPAINAGIKNGAPTIDQRNVARDSQPDAGAFEVVSTTSSPSPATPQQPPTSGNSTIDDNEIITPVDSPITFDKPLIDLRKIDLNQDGQVDSKVSTVFENIRSNSRLQVSVGFYKVANEDGAVVNPDTRKLVSPDEEGYIQAVSKQRIWDIHLHQGRSNLITELEGGALYAPFLITREQVPGLQRFPVYFNYGTANSDKASHIKLLGNNQFGFEDAFGGGDQSFNDFTFTVKLERA
ncbi:MAG: choice-of-anchor Q domain-containing protein [Scytonema sp. PMC 1069.18]|nr:choice-of-anchor Q domain-containing protein [Scytonema sp. PMC 1069.18]MEC4880678.1 choice-of-anchor Q domain-containing protein [Scytonema sp. PMC 1070.18]